MQMKSFINEFKNGTRYFAESISFLVNSFLFSFVYIIGIGLTSLFLKILGRHTMNINRFERVTFWQKRTEESGTNINIYYNQF